MVYDIGKHGSTSRSPEDVARCTECGSTRHVTIDEIARAPWTMPKHCGQIMELVPMDEVDEVLRSRKHARGVS